MSQVTAVVLAGGIGKRFQPFVTDKTLFPFCGQSLIERTLKQLTDAGIRQIIVATNRHNHESIAAVASRFDADIQLSQQNEPKGMADALLSVRELLPEKDIIVTNAGDMVSDHLLRELLTSINGQYGVITGMVTPTYQPLGYLVLDGARVTGIAEKPGADKMPSDVANLVFHYFSQTGEFVNELSAISQTETTDDIYEQALTRLLQRHEFGLYRYEGPWQKLKFGYHVLDMMNFFFADLPNYQHPETHIAETATIRGNVYIEQGARIFDGATIIGPAYIGAKAIVGNNALVRQSMVESEAVIGFGSEVARSYIGHKCDLHHAYVGDSVLEHHVHFGYNAHTANLRFDQKAITLKLPQGKLETDKNKLGALIAAHTEIGVNASILPGIGFGTHALVYPAAVVHEPLGDHQTLKWIQTQEIVKKD